MKVPSILRIIGLYGLFISAFAVAEPPQITSSAHTEAEVGQAYSYQVLANDPESGALVYELAIFPDGMSISSGGLVSWAPTAEASGNQVFKIHVRDQEGLLAYEYVDLAVTDPNNQVPQINQEPITDALVTSPYSYDLQATDADNDALSYSVWSWPQVAGLSISDQGVVNLAPTNRDAAGEYWINIEVNDGHLGIAKKQFMLTVSDPNNQSPVIVGEPLSEASVAATYTYGIQASDSDSDLLSYNIWSWPAMTALSISDQGLITWESVGREDAGEYWITVEVDDGHLGIARKQYVLTVSDPSNQSPVIIGDPLSEASVGATYTYGIQASDSDSDILSYNIWSWPEMTALEISDEGLITWTPANRDDAGEYWISVEVDDGHLGISKKQYKLKVIDEDNTVPVVGQAPILEAYVGQPYTYSVSSSDSDGDTLTYELSTWPKDAGVQLSAVGEVTWTPTRDQVGDQWIRVTVDDGHLGVATVDYTLNVSDPSNQAPVITSTPLTQTVVGVTYLYALSASDGNGDNITFTLLDGPEGMALDSTTNTISWTPTGISAEGERVKVDAKDDFGGFVRQEFRLYVVVSGSGANDLDGDGYLDDQDAFPNDPAEWLDTDGDGEGNNADLDDDNDGVADDADACPLEASETTDTDGDGICNSSDPNDDNDLVLDMDDDFPLDPTETVDTDGDGLGNNTDPDDDNDLVLDVDDDFPLDPTETVDTDGDGVGNNADPDDDNDGVADDTDACPLDASGTIDTDGDGLCNNADPDDDNDLVLDVDDDLPLDATETVDTDGDGLGNNADLDDDNDTVLDVDDEFPLDSTESSDLDGDGIGDNSDPDRDNDMVANDSDAYPNDSTRSVLPIVNINTPLTLSTVGETPITVTGVVAAEATTLTVNGVPVTFSGGQFSTTVSLREGHNAVVARMVTSSGEVSTSSIAVSLDATPPYLTVESHVDGQTVFDDRVSISGLINDIVRGTIEETEALVTVNGLTASISNRGYLAENIPLTPGLNTITVSASDQVGNTKQTIFTLDYQAPIGKRLEVVSGQGQTAEVAATLGEALAIRVLDDSGQPVGTAKVIFRVMQGAGLLSASDYEGRAVIVDTDAEGIARAQFKLGFRAGAGNQKVRARVVGYDDEQVFYASVSQKLGDKIGITAGNNQRGGVFQRVPSPLIVSVTDEGSNRVEDAPVLFQVASGGGYFENGEQELTVITDADGRASVHFTLGAVVGLDKQRVVATLAERADTVPSNTIIRSVFTASAFVTGPAGDTTISGIILDNQSNPLSGTTIRVEGTSRQAIADIEGRFTITEVPVGPVHLIFDGSTVDAEGEFPTLSSNIVTVSGVDNPLTKPIYLVKLNMDNAVYAGLQDVSISLDAVPGFKLEIPAGSVTFPDGSKEGYVSVTMVNASAVPMTPPNGMQPKFIVTVQPTGAMFDAPARLTMPNVDGFLPGKQVEIFSFDHDLEEFATIGFGSVSEDGKTITSNPGVGIVKAGWTCAAENAANGVPYDCGFCEKCNSVGCAPVPGKEAETQIPFNCQKELCEGSKDDNSDEPDPSTDVENDCKRPGCVDGSPGDIDDNTDISVEDEDCKECNAGSLTNKSDGTAISGEPCSTCQGGVVSAMPDGVSSNANQCCFNGNTRDNTWDPGECPAPVANGAAPIVNGCTGVPDNPNYTNICMGYTNPLNRPSFTSACNGHDSCYDQCGASKESCDQAFGNSMRAICDSIPAAGCREDCYDNATVYEGGVDRAPALAFYNPSQRRVCSCCQ